MMKKILCVLLITVFAVSLVACDIDDYAVPNVEESIEELQYDDRTKIPYPSETPPESNRVSLAKNGINFKGLRFVHVDGIGDMYLFRTKPNEDVFRLYEKVETKQNTKWKLFRDISGTEEIPSKSIALVPGDNIYYVVTENDKGDIAMYIVNIYRNKTYQVACEYGLAWDVEESTYLDVETIPEGQRDGYIFKGWNYDFSIPVTSNTNITGIWEVDPGYIPVESKPTIEIEYVGSNNTTNNEYNVWFNIVSSETFGIVDVTSSIGNTYKFHRDTGLISKEPIMQINAYELEEHQLVVKFEKQAEPFALKFVAKFRNNDTEIIKDIYLLFENNNVEIIDSEMYQKIIDVELVENN